VWAVESLETRTLMAAPVIDVIGSQTLPGGTTLYVPVTGSDSDNDTVTYSVSTNNSNVTATVLTGNPYLQVDVAGYGTMVFQLFADTAPNTVRVMTQLANARYFDGIRFHRVIDNFVIQGGDSNTKNTYVDANGDGRGDAGDNIWGQGGPGFEFDDEFSSLSFYTGKGQLAMAKSSDDTNGSQFFVTDSTTSTLRNLGFQHTIWGQLVRGFDVLDNILAINQFYSGPATGGNAGGDQPLNAPVITSARVIVNNRDAVLRVSAPAGVAATVTVTGSDGTTPVQRQFTVTGTTNPLNDPPFLGPIAKGYVSPVNTPFILDLTSIDADTPGATQAFAAQVVSGNVTLNTTTGVTLAGNRVIVTPANGFVGRAEIAVAVVQQKPGGSDFDIHNFTVGFGDAALTPSPFGFNSAGATPMTNAVVGGFSSADPSDTAGNFTASINWGDGKSGSGVTTGTVVSDGVGGFLVRGSHTYDFAGTYNVEITVTGNLGASTVINSTALVAQRVSLINNVLTVSGTSGADVFTLGDNGTTLSATVNGVTSTFSSSQITSLVILTQEGNDSVTPDGSFAKSTVQYGGLGADTLIGGNAADTLAAGKGNDVLLSRFGPDSLIGGLGNDSLGAGKGFDTLVGGGGNDTLQGGLGVDSIDAGDGDDLIYARDGFVDIVRGGTGGDTYQADTGSVTDDVLDVEYPLA